MLDFLKGKKTYILVVIGAIGYGLALAGIITEDMLEKVLTLLGIGAVGTLRAGISK